MTHSLSCFSCVRLSVTLWTVIHKATLSMGFSHEYREWVARILEWIAMLSSKGSSWPRDWTHVFLCLLQWQAGFFFFFFFFLPLAPSGKSPIYPKHAQTFILFIWIYPMFSTLKCSPYYISKSYIYCEAWLKCHLKIFFPGFPKRKLFTLQWNFIILYYETLFEHSCANRNTDAHHVFAVQLLSHVRLFVTPWTAAARLPCPSLSPRVCLNSCPLSQWWYLTMSFSAAPFSFCLPSFLASGSFPMSQLLAPGGQSTGALASVLPMNIQVCSLYCWSYLLFLKGKDHIVIASNLMLSFLFLILNALYWLDLEILLYFNLSSYSFHRISQSY